MIPCKKKAIMQVQIPIKTIKATEYFNVNLKRSDSFPTSPTAAQAIAML